MAILRWFAANYFKLIVISVGVVVVCYFYWFGTKNLTSSHLSSNDRAADRRLKLILNLKHKPSIDRHDEERVKNESKDEKSRSVSENISHKKDPNRPISLSFKNPDIQLSLHDTASQGIDVFILFTKAKDNHLLRQKFSVMVKSLLDFSSLHVNLYVIGDDESQVIAKNIIQKLHNKKGELLKNYTLKSLDIDAMTRQLHSIILPLQKFFSARPDAYYADSLFFLSVVIHRVVPETIHKAVMLDSDLKFLTDIKELYSLFSDFTPNQVMGIAYEMQPVYRHTFANYRQAHPGTRVGGPPPDGKPGFNSGVLLLDLDKMRHSQIYNAQLNEAKFKELTSKYDFRGHLGDQDLYTLLGMELSDLFYVLPCTWNRQLCKWWRDKGYEQVFDLYYTCDGRVNIYHGNCNTQIPVTSLAKKSGV